MVRKIDHAWNLAHLLSIPISNVLTHFLALTRPGWATDNNFRISLLMGSWWVPQWIMRWVGSCVMGPAMPLGGVMCVKGSSHGWGYVFVGHYMGGAMYGVTHLVMGPPILGRVPSVQSSLLEKVSVAGQGGSILALVMGLELSGPVRDTPPYRAIPLRDSIAEGGIAPICLVFIGYRASIAEIPLLRGGGIAPPLRTLSNGETLTKGGGRIAPIWPCWDPKNPIACNREVSLR